MTATETRARNQPQDKPVIQVDDVSKLFRTPSEGTIGALQDVSLTIPPNVLLRADKVIR